LKDTGYEAFIVDEQDLDSDTTINDAIIAGLKRIKFCVADFCLHENGGYFESDYGFGQGTQVTYECNIEEFGKTHIDTNHFHHIVHENSRELYQRLVDKIEARII